MQQSVIAMPPTRLINQLLQKGMSAATTTTGLAAGSAGGAGHGRARHRRRYRPRNPWSPEEDALCVAAVEEQRTRYVAAMSTVATVVVGASASASTGGASPSSVVARVEKIKDGEKQNQNEAEKDDSDSMSDDNSGLVIKGAKGKETWICKKEFAIDWIAVQKVMDGKRTAKQCRERWMLRLDPKVSKLPWTDEEDEELLRLYRMYGRSWAFISREMGNSGRSEHACKSRWRSLMNMMDGDDCEDLDDDYQSGSSAAEAERIKESKKRKQQHHQIRDEPKVSQSKKPKQSAQSARDEAKETSSISPIQTENTPKSSSAECPAPLSVVPGSVESEFIQSVQRLLNQGSFTSPPSFPVSSYPAPFLAPGFSLQASGGQLGMNSRFPSHFRPGFGISPFAPNFFPMYPPPETISAGSSWFPPLPISRPSPSLAMLRQCPPNLEPRGNAQG